MLRLEALKAQAKSKREAELVELAFRNGFDAGERAAQDKTRQALQMLGLVTSDQIEEWQGPDGNAQRRDQT